MYMLETHFLPKCTSTLVGSADFDLASFARPRNTRNAEIKHEIKDVCTALPAPLLRTCQPKMTAPTHSIQAALKLRQLLVIHRPSLLTHTLYTKFQVKHKLCESKSNHYSPSSPPMKNTKTTLPWKHTVLSLDYVDDSRTHTHTTPCSAVCWIALYHVGRHKILSRKHAILETVVEHVRFELADGVFQVFQVLRGPRDLFFVWGLLVHRACRRRRLFLQSSDEQGTEESERLCCQQMNK